MLLRKKAQSTLEYSILFAIIVAALLALNIYMKRGFQGRLRSSADDIGEQFDAQKTNSTSTTKRTAKTVEETSVGQTTTYTGEEGKGSAEVVKRTSTETVSEW